MHTCVELCVDSDTNSAEDSDIGTSTDSDSSSTSGSDSESSSDTDDSPLVLQPKRKPSESKVPLGPPVSQPGGNTPESKAPLGPLVLQPIEKPSESKAQLAPQLGDELSESNTPRESPRARVPRAPLLEDDEYEILSPAELKRIRHGFMNFMTNPDTVLTVPHPDSEAALLTEGFAEGKEVHRMSLEEFRSLYPKLSDLKADDEALGVIVVETKGEIELPTSFFSNNLKTALQDGTLHFHLDAPFQQSFIIGDVNRPAKLSGKLGNLVNPKQKSVSEIASKVPSSLSIGDFMRDTSVFTKKLGKNKILRFRDGAFNKDQQSQVNEKVPDSLNTKKQHWHLVTDSEGVTTWMVYATVGQLFEANLRQCTVTKVCTHGEFMQNPFAHICAVFKLEDDGTYTQVDHDFAFNY